MSQLAIEAIAILSIGRTRQSLNTRIALSHRGEHTRRSAPSSYEAIARHVHQAVTCTRMKLQLHAAVSIAMPNQLRLA